MKRYRRWRGKRGTRGGHVSRVMEPNENGYEEAPSDILFKGEVRQRAARNAEC